MAQVYGIMIKKSRKYIYVGCTSVGLSVRFCAHFTKNSKIAAKYRKRDLRIVELEVAFENARETEDKWMTKLMAEGHPIINRNRSYYSNVPTNSKVTLSIKLATEEREKLQSLILANKNVFNTAPVLGISKTALYNIRLKGSGAPYNIAKIREAINQPVEA